MHMADALITATVGGAMGVAATGVTAYSVSKLKKDEEFESKIPLMGVVGAFVFAAQMINFTIPGTGSSGHIGGGVLLAAILGPEAGFLALLSILIIQCLFFGDGGLLALGCNIINMGFFACFIGYKLVYKKIISKGYSKKRIMLASIIGVTVGLQLGSLGVVLETLASGVTELPFSTFLLFMQPIHLIIGVIEGLLTGVVLNFIWQNRSDILQKTIQEKTFNVSKKKVISVFLVAALVCGGGISLIASSNPDGLEWSIFKTAGSEELGSSEDTHKIAAEIQETTAFLPDYGLKVDEASLTVEKIGTIIAGVAGVSMTVVLITGIGYISRKRKIIKEGQTYNE